MKNRRTRLRAPLVVTLSLSALGGCGGVVVSPGPAPACPAAPPASGAACVPVAANLSCTWGRCEDGGRTVARCDTTARRWEVTRDRCIEPPACPASRPTEGSVCFEGGESPCTYGWNECLRGPDTVARCEGGRWRLAVSTCNPPPPMCPSDAPETNGACALPPTMQCTYGDCAGSPTAFARCAGGRWQVAMVSCNPPPPPPVTCPAEAPQSGMECALPTGHAPCGYGDCDGVPTIEAQCESGRWALRAQSCNPPPPVICPGDLPFEGDRCDGGDSARCGYGLCAEGPAVYARCSAGRWVIEREMCGAYCPPERPRAGSPCSRDAMDPCRYPGVMCGGTRLSNEAQCNPMTHRWVITEFTCG